ncbi:hypothetical protein K1719_043964 [Acacia pycnantha]|nr:hypothetical protein K1719_043964 [Acacia pycnantha]
MVIIMDSNKIFLLSFIPFLFSPCQSEAASVSPTSTTGSQGKGGISSKTIVAVVVPISMAVLYDSDLEGKLQYELTTIEAATDMFSIRNKIGQGGSGEVYKGMLPVGQEIVVKRLFKDSQQSAKECKNYSTFFLPREEEFKNEVEVLARLQHQNLVRLLGFCEQEQERILVYEYMANGSLDYILFNPEKQKHLDWTKRYQIVKGIVQGIQYFHGDARLKIIHGDLKTSNILLDCDMNPKISDLGTAKILLFGETKGNAYGVCGTYSYMAPEHVLHAVYSIKSDVFSFGVLLLEIISGRKNHDQINGAESLLSYAWELWNDGKPLELLDPTIREYYAPNEVIRCIHIGLRVFKKIQQIDLQCHPYL